MKNIYLIVLTLLLWSCNDFKKIKQEEPVTQIIESFDENAILINGKLKRFFEYSEFEQIFGEPDSIVSFADVMPCTALFKDQFNISFKSSLYKNKHRFETSGDSVALSSFEFTKDNYIKYENHILNIHTTKQDIQKLFPNAMQFIHDITDLTVDTQKREIMLLNENTERGEIIYMYFKNEKLKSIRWTGLC